MSTTTKPTAKRPRVDYNERLHRCQNLINTLNDLSKPIDFTALTKNLRFNWNESAKSVRYILIHVLGYIKPQKDFPGYYEWTTAGADIANDEAAKNLVQAIEEYVPGTARGRRVPAVSAENGIAATSTTETVTSSKRAGKITLTLDELHAVGLSTLLRSVKADGLYTQIRNNILKQLKP